MRCIIVGASMPMPTEELKYEDSWVHLFWQKHKDIEIVTRLSRGSSSLRLKNEGPGGNGKDVLEFYNPDFAILHIGLSDASPRLLPRKNIFVYTLNLTPFAKYVYRFLRKYSGRKIKYCDMSVARFKECFDNYAERCSVNNVKLFIVELSHATQAIVDKKSPLINESIDLYNNALREIGDKYPSVVIIPGIDGDEKLYQSDGYHLNKDGQYMMFDRISRSVDEYLSQSNYL